MTLQRPAISALKSSSKQFDSYIVGNTDFQKEMTTISNGHESEIPGLVLQSFKDMLCARA